MSQAVRRVDTAVIGGGVAGAYCAWRLAGSDGAGSIAVFERQDRVAGRLWSVPVNPGRGQVAELGGMRIAPNHGIARDLIGHLSMPTMPFVASGDNAFVYLRGVRKRRADIRAAGDFPYDLPDHLARMTPEEMIAAIGDGHGLVAECLVHDTTCGAWTSEWRVGGSSYCTSTTAQLLEHFLGAEGAAFILDWIGYSMEDVAAPTWVGEVAGVTHGEYLTIRGGMQALPEALLDGARSRGADVVTGTTLVALEPDGAAMRLHLEDSEGRTQEVLASSVVLALTPPAFTRLRATSPVLAGSDVLGRALAQALPYDSVKAYFAFDRPWWRDLDIETGRSVTDGPIRQCIYFPPDPEGPAMMLASYAFGDGAASHWKTLGPSEGCDGFTPPAHAFVEEMTAHLSALHGYDVPLPVDARVRWWGHDGEAANWLWGVGGSVWDLSREVRHPVAAMPIHICGDCFSLNQGWVQGALQSAELVLREAYGMQAAPWMSDSATLGDDVHLWEGM